MASEVVLALPHKLRVMRMYRTGLKELINWSATRHEWYPRVRKRRLAGLGSLQSPRPSGK